LRNLLATSSLLSATAASPGNVLRSTEQLGDLVALAAALLPPIPDAAAAMLQDVPPSPSFGGALGLGWRAKVGCRASHSGGNRRKAWSLVALLACPHCAADGDEAATAAGQRGGGEACQRARFLRDNPALLQKLSADLLPLLIKVCPRPWQHSWGGGCGLATPAGSSVTCLAAGRCRCWWACRW
jgi:hypothetical protein